MQKINPPKVRYIHRQLLRWYHRHQRELSWRTTTDPYVILLSEIMLQQTQVQRVQIKLREFLTQFPSIRKLARAPVADVVRAWRGMGYNRRAVHLKRLAWIVVNEYAGKIPDNPEMLRSLPGIGKYTSNAIACFAYHRRVPVVEVNVRRVLSRYFWRMKDLKTIKTDVEIWELAERILHRNAWDWNQGLMDLGATICTGTRVRCTYCPLRMHCSSRHLETITGSRNNKIVKFSEPMYDGIPHRLWRGKIIEILRDVPSNTSMEIFRIGKMLKKNFRSGELSWLTGLIRGLANDGLLEYAGSGKNMKVKLITQ